MASFSEHDAGSVAPPDTARPPLDTREDESYSRCIMFQVGSMAATSIICASSSYWYWFTSGFSSAR